MRRWWLAIGVVLASILPAVAVFLQRAQGVLIYPQVLRGAFVVGGSGGSGTLVVRDPKNRRRGGGRDRWAQRGYRELLTKPGHLRRDPGRRGCRAGADVAQPGLLR